VDERCLDEDEDLPGQGSRQRMQELPRMLGQEREQCHIPQALSGLRIKIPQATSHKPQASSAKLREPRATSLKPQA